MLWWLVDNANLVLLVLGLVALGFGVHFWLTRRGASLVGLGGVIALMGLVWVLSMLVVTDRKQLVLIVDDVAARLNKRDLAGAFNHFEDRVRLEIDGEGKSPTRGELVAMATELFKKGQIEEIRVRNVEVEKVDRPNAVVSFGVYTNLGYGQCQAECVLHGEKDWRVKKLKIELPPGGPKWIRLPGWR